MTDAVLITGATGQDGFYLASQLAAKGIRVIGTTRDLMGASARVEALAGMVELVEWDLIDRAGFEDLLRARKPRQVFNLAACTSGEFMDRNPEAVTDINGVAVLRMLEAIREVDPEIRFCQASSSEVFAASGVSPQNEDTPRAPRSVYGAAKVYADSIIALYRQKYGLFACSAFLFNHESPLRGEGFVTQKIVKAAVRISRREQDRVMLGNLTAARDWSFAGDFTRAMIEMLAQGVPRDYVLASGRAHTVGQFCERAFGLVGLDYRDHVVMDERYYRDSEPEPIVGDISRASRDLGWQPEVSFEALIELMIEAEKAKPALVGDTK